MFPVLAEFVGGLRVCLPVLCLCIWSSVCSLCVCFRKAQQMSAIIKHHGATAVCITTHTNREQHACSQSAVYTTPLPFPSLSVSQHRHFTFHSWATKRKLSTKISHLSVTLEFPLSEWGFLSKLETYRHFHCSFKNTVCFVSKALYISITWTYDAVGVLRP